MNNMIKKNEMVSQGKVLVYKFLILDLAQEISEIYDARRLIVSTKESIDLVNKRIECLNAKKEMISFYKENKHFIDYIIGIDIEDKNSIEDLNKRIKHGQFVIERFKKNLEEAELVLSALEQRKSVYEQQLIDLFLSI